MDRQHMLKDSFIQCVGVMVLLVPRGFRGCWWLIVGALGDLCGLAGKDILTIT